MTPQSLVLFGATGSLGGQVLDVVREFPDRFEVTGLSAGADRHGLELLRQEFACQNAFLATSMNATADGLATRREDLVGEDTDIVVFCEGRIACRDVLLKSIAMRKKIVLANKELLVSFGEDIMYLARELSVDIVPLDSELSAVRQALIGEDGRTVKRVILTASGGALRGRPWTELRDIRADEVLRHPTWRMGKKITVDSATLVNKALEVIETHFLFDLPYDKIEVRLHPDSLIHAIVEFEDGFSKLVVSEPDMKACVRYALVGRDVPRAESREPREGTTKQSPTTVLSLRGGGTPTTKQSPRPFDFDRPLELSTLEAGRFPCFDLVLKIATDKPELLRTVVQADEQAVADFLEGKLSYHGILDRLLDVYREHRSILRSDNSVTALA